MTSSLPATRRDAPPPESPAVLRSAFRDLHGARLHGFTLLVTLGDRALAARAAAQALADGAAEADRLRHPERAAAWLRARALDHVPHRGIRARDEGFRTLQGLGLDRLAFDGLAALGTLQRAALVAADVERLAQRDVEIVVDRDAPVTRRLLRDARRRYLEAAVASSGERAAPPGPAGELATRLQATADQAVGTAAPGGER